MTPDTKEPQDDSPGVPTWIVSFSDMVTLLLAFFVLLQSLSSRQDPELFHVGQGSFNRAIDAFGLPGLLLGRENRPKRDYRELRYPTKETEEKLKRSKHINAEDDRIRKAFDDLRKMMDTKSSDVKKEKPSVEVTPISFKRFSARLDASARAFLSDFAFNLGQEPGAKPIRLYVIGLAAEDATKKRQWLLSARRAGAVEKALREGLAKTRPAGDWDVCSWGGGPGGQRCWNLRLIPGQSFIVIAILRG